jgi:hypothetical protein
MFALKRKPSLVFTFGLVPKQTRTQRAKHKARQLKQDAKRCVRNTLLAAAERFK